MLCHAMLRCAMLCYAVPCQVAAWEAGDDALPGAAAQFEEPGRFGMGIGRVLAAKAADEPASPTSPRAKSREGGARDGEEAAADEEEEGAAGAEKPVDAARSGAEVQTSLLYRPFAMYTHWRRATQAPPAATRAASPCCHRALATLLLRRDATRCSGAQAILASEQQEETKLAFNAQFDKMLELKQHEMERLGEKRARIAEIAHEMRRMQMACESDDVAGTLALHVDETPEVVLRVDDREIKAEKLLSAEEAARQKKLREDADARAAGGGGDGMAERGLKLMMDGTLESRKAEDELFLELEEPEWLGTPDDEMDDEMKEAKKEFEAKKKAQQAEREKRAKGLIIELGKARTDIVEICRAFNERLAGLGETKRTYERAVQLPPSLIVLHPPPPLPPAWHRYERAVFESELMAIKWTQARLEKEAADGAISRLAGRLREVRDRKKSTLERSDAFRGEHDVVVESHEALAAEDKALEKGFRREFQDALEFMDVLLKLYRRRRTYRVTRGANIAQHSMP